MTVRATQQDPASLPRDSRRTTATTLRLLAASALIGTTPVLAGCSGGSSGGGTAIPATVPDFAAAVFSNPTQIDNPFLPLVPGKTAMLREESPDGIEIIAVEILDETRVVAGVTARVVRDRAFEGELLIEDTFDWFAQDDAGNVWYLGEDSTRYEYDDDDNLIDTDTEGSWESGLDVAGNGRLASPGFVMEAAPMAGDVYHQEYYRGEAEDQGEIIALDVPVLLDDGTMHTCLQVRDSSRLERGAEEDKFYASEIGLVLERQVGGPAKAELLGTFETGPASIPVFGAAVFNAPAMIANPLVAFEPGTAVAFLGRGEDDGEVSTETIVVELQDTTRMILGIACAIVRDRVFQDGLLVEDSLFRAGAALARYLERLTSRAAFFRDSLAGRRTMTWSRVSLEREAIPRTSAALNSRAACTAEALSSCSLTIERSKDGTPFPPDHLA